jgi:ubiquinone/menaquinone biosynthesis C-methylase UbiE
MQIIKRLNRYEETGRLLLVELQNGSILDAGCGENLYKVVNPAIIGVDIASKEADMLADISSLPFDKATFDKVLCFGVFSDDDMTCDKQLVEILRVTKAGGIIYLRCLLNHVVIDKLSKLQIYKPAKILVNKDTGDERFFAAYYNKPHQPA